MMSARRISIGRLVVMAIAGLLLGRSIAYQRSLGGLEGALGAGMLLVLLAGIALVTLLVGLALGLAVRRRGRPGRPGRASAFAVVALLLGSGVGGLTAPLLGGTYREPVVLDAPAQMLLRLDPAPASFVAHGQGQSACRSQPDERTAVNFAALDLGSLGPGTLRAGLDLALDGSEGTLELFLDGGSLPEGSEQVSWSGAVSASMLAPDHRQGRVVFHDLPLLRQTGKPAESPGAFLPPQAWPTTLSGQLDWTCDPWPAPDAPAAPPPPSQVPAVTPGQVTAPPPSATRATSPPPTPLPTPTGRLLFSAVEPGDTVATIGTMNADGTDRLALAVGDEPAWSPDGTMIAFLGSDGTGIWTMRSDGSGATRIRHDEAMVYQWPSWSPDGQSISFTEQPICSPCSVGVPSTLTVMRADGTGARAVVTTASVGGQAVWAPDGSVVFNQAFESGLWSIQPDGSGLRQLSTGPDGYPEWSRDGHLAFLRGDGAAADGTTIFSLVIAEGDGSGSRVFPLPFAGGGPLAWSPDGNWIAMTGTEALPIVTGTQWDLWIIRADGTGARTLVSTPDVSEGFPGWR